MFKVTFQWFGNPESFSLVFHSREDTEKFIGMNDEKFAMIKIVEIFH